MKTYASQKKPFPTAFRPHRPAFVPHPVTTADSTRNEISRILRGPSLQAKLTVGPPDDIYEREADRVADEVMRMPEPRVQAAPT
jgi:hypothetical protein